MLIVTVLPGCQDDVRCRKASLRRSASRSKEVDGHMSHSPGNQTVARQRLAVVCEQVFFFHYISIHLELSAKRENLPGGTNP